MLYKGFGVMVFNGHYLRLWLLQYGSQEKILLTFYGLVSVTVRKASPDLFLSLPTGRKPQSPTP